MQELQLDGGLAFAAAASVLLPLSVALLLSMFGVFRRAGAVLVQAGIVVGFVLLFAAAFVGAGHDWRAPVFMALGLTWPWLLGFGIAMATGAWRFLARTGRRVRRRR